MTTTEAKKFMPVRWKLLRSFPRKIQLTCQMSIPKIATNSDLNSQNVIV
jgi:hypothetical protein